MALISPDTNDVLFLKAKVTSTPNEFYDESFVNKKTVTANGNAKRLELPSAFGQGAALKRTAMFFNGTTDYVEIANSADFAPGTGAFTVEVYFNTGIAATAQTILDTRTATANTTGFLLNIINSTGNKLCFTTATTARITGSTTLAINTWYKAKVTGNGGADGARTVILELATADGTYAQEGSTYTNNYNFTDQTLRIGSIKATAGTYFNGWLKNLTITKAGVTVLDLRGDSPANSPLGPAIYFDGTGDYIYCADNNVWTFGSSNTIEFFFNLPAVSGNYVFVYHGPSGTDHSGFMWQASDGKFHWVQRVGGSNTIDVSWTYALTANVNYHVALVKDGNDYEVFVNGISLGTVTDATAITNFTGNIYFGLGYDVANAVKYVTGYMREIRFSDSVRYASNFTPSQTGFTVDSNTKLYIKGNENNGATTFLDSETTPKTVTTAGDTKIKYTESYLSCVFKDETGKFPYPKGSAKIDFFSAFGSGVKYAVANGDNLTAPNSSDFDFGTGNFTMEFFGRRSSVASAHELISKYTSSGWEWYENGTTMRLYKDAAIYSTTLPAESQNLNTWQYYVVCRNGNTLNYFYNGSILASADVTGVSFDGAATTLMIGGYNTGTGVPFQGLQDNIRISKGIARYTATFNPPSDYEVAGGFLPFFMGV